MSRQGAARPSAVAAAVVVVALTLGGCASVGVEDLNPTEWFSAPSARPWEGGFTVSRGTATPETRQVTASDFVGADGQCQGGAPAEAPGGIALTMTECELVAAAGVPEQVDISADENGDRRAVLTYTTGENSGVYTFVSGRLKVIEGLPEPPGQQRRRRRS